MDILHSHVNKPIEVAELRPKVGELIGEAEHLPDFLSSKDDWFRPVNLEFGPDGCLYVADFYNKIISHNEVTTDHPDRDKAHGRIWRIRHKSQKPREIPNVAKASPQDLLAHLKLPTSGKSAPPGNKSETASSPSSPLP